MCCTGQEGSMQVHNQLSQHVPIIVGVVSKQHEKLLEP